MVVPFPQLTGAVVTPGEEAAIGLQRQRMKRPCGQGNYIGNQGRLGYPVRSTTLHHSPVSQLAVGIVPPGPQRAVTLRGQGVEVAGREGDPTPVGAYPCRNGLWRCRALGDLAEQVVSPGPQ